MNEPRILVVDDEKDICRALQFLLSHEGYDVKTAQSGEEAVELLRKKSYDIVLTDLKMDKIDGIGVLEEAKNTSPDTEVVLMTAYASVESAVEAMKKGAADYIVKPFINEEIRLTVRRILEQKSLQNENLALRRELSQYRNQCKDFIFSSEQMARIFDLLDSIIPTKSNVLLLGESGTGKGILAEIIHCGSPRNGKAFISINCSAIPENLLESELFGYKKGAFTGASSDKKGLIEMADGGTLFLDEIGDMPPQLQSKLLKVIETGEFMSLGDTKTKHSDIRVVAATHQDLDAKVKDGSFREDLYYRLSVFEILIPPLRERREDIPLLVDHFVRKFARANNKKIEGLSDEAMDAIIKYGWPGNVRELNNAIERAVVLTAGSKVSVEQLPEKVRHGADESSGSSLKDMINDYERKAIARIYEANSNNKDATAKALGIDLATLYRKMKKLGLSD